MEKIETEKIITKFEEAYKWDKETEVDKTKPFDNRYKSREIYISLLEEISKEIFKNEIYGRNILELIINLLVGTNFLETEERGGSQKYFEKCLEIIKNDEFLRKLEKNNLFLVLLIDLFNTLGFNDINKDENKTGLFHLKKAHYFFKNKKNEEISTIEITKNIELNKILNSVIKKFFNFSKKDDLNLMTEFFLAQAYGKLQDAENSAYFCGQTLQKQVEKRKKGEIPQNWDLTDFANNCMGLSQYYIDKHFYLESLQILFLGIEIVEEESTDDDKDLLGHIYFQLGNTYKNLFDYNLILVLAHSKLEFHDKQIHINKKTLDLVVKKKIEDLVIFENYSKSKEYFKKSLKFYKNAMEILKLDGFVTEYVEITKNIISLYKLLFRFEKEKGRIIAIELRIQDYINKLLKIISEIHYKKIIIELTAELAESQTREFERFLENYLKKGKKLLKMNKKGKECLKNWQKVIDYFFEIKETKNQSLINCLYNKGRILTKIVESDNLIAKENLIKALEVYGKVKEIILEIKKENGVLDADLENQLKVTSEFCDLLPVRISKY